MTELLSAALLDMNWHGIQEPIEDVEAFEAAALKKRGWIFQPYRRAIAAAISPISSAAGTRRVLRLPVDANAGGRWLSVVCRAGWFDPRNGQTFREAILSRGNSTDLAELYRNWRGHDPKIEPMLENRGLSA